MDRRRASIYPATYPLPLTFAFLGAGVLGAGLSEPSLSDLMVSMIQPSPVSEAIPIVISGGDADAGDVLL